jgi:hypothetical protein
VARMIPETEEEVAFASLISKIPISRTYAMPLATRSYLCPAPLRTQQAITTFVTMAQSIADEVFPNPCRAFLILVPAGDGSVAIRHLVLSARCSAATRGRSAAGLTEPRPVASMPSP